MNSRRLLTLMLLALQSMVLYAQRTPWKDIDDIQLRSQQGERWIQPVKYRALELNMSELENLLHDVPERFSGITSKTLLNLPMPDGSFQSFNIEEAPLMHPDLARAFPGIRTFSGQGVGDPSSAVYLDVTPNGFHAMILAPGSAVFIDPYFKNDSKHYLSYNKRDLAGEKAKGFSCGVAASAEDKLPSVNMQPVGSRSVGVDLRTYRIAITATGEYTAFHGGTTTAAMSAINTTLNRVRGIYETELAISFTLVTNNSQIVYTDAATDPFTDPQSNSTTLTENQTNTDNVIGSANYDIGHLMTNGNGGIAVISSVCQASTKAKGMTGSNGPVGDPFDVDFVAHEIGHQFGAHHTFNGNVASCSGGNRYAGTAYEPESGSTILAYAGICGSQNLQYNTHNYFHRVSMDEIHDFVVNGGGSTCPTTSASGNNTPTVNANAENIDGKYIPKSTPFELTASGSDTDGNPITYCWEQYDLGTEGSSSTNTDGPVFRSFPPASTPTRMFPKLDDIIENTNGVGEFLPSITRDLNFKCTVRDNQSAGGGSAYGSVVLHVTDQAGPFTITSYNSSENVEGNITVTWYVGGTDQSPVNCSQVDILASTDGGVSFSTLKSATANDGSEEVTLPGTVTGQARIKVKCSDNVFFDINNADLRIVPTGATCAERVTNGDLEVSTGWTEYSTNGFPLIGAHSFVHGGSNSAWLGGFTNETSRISQSLSIPASQHFSNLEFWYRVTTFDCAKDIFNIKINGSIVQSVSLCNNTASGDWERELIDLSAYQGTSPEVMFEVICDADNHSSVFIDDVSVYTCEGGQSPLLPVELVNFNAVAEGNDALLSWETQHEINNEGFGIEMKNADGVFKRIAFVEGAGSTSEKRFYHHRVDDLRSGVYYFRLRQMDTNGSFAHSPVRSVIVQGDQMIKVQPNPARDLVFFEMTLTQNEDIRLDVLNSKGQLVGTVSNDRYASGTFKLPYHLSGLPAGIYFYRITSRAFEEAGRFVVE